MTPGEIRRILAEYLVEARPTLAAVDNLEHVSLRDVLDSIDMLSFLAFIEARFDIEIESSDVTPEHFSSIMSVGQFIDTKFAVRASS